MNQKQAKQAARHYAAKLIAPAFDPQELVIAKSVDEMSMSVFDSAFAVRWNEWYLVFVEHQDARVFHEEEWDVMQVKRAGMDEYKEDPIDQD